MITTPTKRLLLVTTRYLKVVDYPSERPESHGLCFEGAQIVKHA